MRHILHLVEQNCRARDYEDIRHLVLHRMTAARILDAPCRRPAGFDLRRYAMEQEALAYPVSRRTIVLKTLFNREAAVHLEERPLAPDQRLSAQPDGGSLLSATVRDTLALRWWLLGFGGKVTVLAPKALRDDFKQIAERMARAYGGG